jgi:uncharacterized coiled-coil protein SlyX
VTETPASGPVSDRMQALLSRAVEEQVSEQRAVSTVLGELRGQVAALSEGIRQTASDSSVERLGGVVSTVVADLRTSTSLLGQRIEALSKRVDAVAADSAAPTEQAAVRLATLGADVAAQSEAIERMSRALDQLSAFPDALAGVQRDVAGVHDRLSPLADVRSDVSNLGTRTAAALDALLPQIDALQSKVEAIGVVPDPERLRDTIIDALGPRLEKLTTAAERPIVGPDALRSGLGDTRSAIVAAVAEQLDDVTAALGAVENRLGQIGERVSEVGDAAGAVPALATDLTRLAGRVEELMRVKDQLTELSAGVGRLLDDSTGTALTLGVASMRDDLEHLGERIAANTPPTADDVAGLVSQRVADRLVETLAPRIADVVLTRVSAVLVTQLGEALSPRVRADTEMTVRAATADSERRILAHVDEAVLALAEALLRRRRGGRSTGSVVKDLLSPDSDEADPEPIIPAEVVVSAEAVDEVHVPEEPMAPGEAVVEQEMPAAPAPEAFDEPHEPDEPIAEVLDRLNAEPPAEPVVVEPAPVAQARAVPVERPGSVTSSLAPPVETSAPEPEPEPEPEPAAPRLQTREPRQPFPSAGGGRSERTTRPAPRPAQGASGAPRPRADPSEPPRVVKAPQRPTAPPPVKKTDRPSAKPPILDRTPDVPDDEIEPVRTTVRPPISRPAPLPEAPLTALPPPDPAPSKRKPWWRPGG